MGPRDRSDVFVAIPPAPDPLWPALCLLAADLAVYVITIHDLTWHILTSADRLWMQLTPALLFAVFAAAAAATEPREAH